jgi:hypothetical protein
MYGCISILTHSAGPSTPTCNAGSMWLLFGRGTVEICFSSGAHILGVCEHVSGIPCDQLPVYHTLISSVFLRFPLLLRPAGRPAAQCGAVPGPLGGGHRPAGTAARGGGCGVGGNRNRWGVGVRVCEKKGGRAACSKTTCGCLLAAPDGVAIGVHCALPASLHSTLTSALTHQDMRMLMHCCPQALFALNHPLCRC